MLAKKNLVEQIAALLALVVLAGCTPAGPQALLTGRQLLESGDPAGAMEKFKLATSLMSSNVQAWNYLGLAAHQAGQVDTAIEAYQHAVKLDRNFVEPRFNLGCLLADQGKTTAARDVFTACTVLRANQPEAWLRRGRCEMQLKDYPAAETSLREALRQSPQDAEALNSLGLVQLQRNKPREAAQSFSAALKLQPDHRAALLNLAITTQQQLNDRPAALNFYRQYLALNPRPADWESVNRLVESLQPSAPAPNPTSQPPPRLEAARPQPATNSRPAELVQRAPAPAPKPAPVAPATNPPQEFVKVAPEPVIRSTPTDEKRVVPVEKPVTNPATNQIVAKPATEAERRSLLSRMFRKDTKPAPRVTPLPEANPPAPTVPAGFTRYTYISPARPAAGNRSECERLLAQGRREQDSKKFTEAVQSYRGAVAADASNFDAQFALGYAAFQIRSFKLSTWAWEHALAIHPDSSDARYNFALALRAMNHVPDAANELEKILATDDKVTKAHLTLGSIYAEQLNDNAKARAHYRRALDLEPSHPRGAEIRQWLVNNKP